MNLSVEVARIERENALLKDQLNLATTHLSIDDSRRANNQFRTIVLIDLWTQAQDALIAAKYLPELKVGEYCHSDDDILKALNAIPVNA